MDVLIIDDRFEEKIGQFAMALKKGNIDFGVAPTLEDANKMFKEHLNEIALIILDLTFPKNDEDKEGIQDRSKAPNGINFLIENEFKMYTKQIELILNSCWDKEERSKKLKMSRYYGENSELMVDMLDENSPLSHLSGLKVTEIIDIINKAIEKHKRIVSAPKESADNADKWRTTTKGRSFVPGGWYTHEGD